MIQGVANEGVAIEPLASEKTKNVKHQFIDVGSSLLVLFACKVMRVKDTLLSQSEGISQYI